jgi:glycosyltransferase involved in cell wall biosynthesis
MQKGTGESMRIGVDARATMMANDGIGRYAVELLQEFSRRDLPHEFFVLKNGQTRVSFAFDERFHEIVLDAGRFGFNEQVLLPRILNPLTLNVFHSLHSALPLGYRGAKVMTIHDIIPVISPWSFGRGWFKDRIASVAMTALIKASVKRASLVAVSSESTRRDLVRHLHADPARLRTVYLGIDHEAFAVPADQGPMLDRWNLHLPLFVTLTNFKPHKNTATLIQAFRILHRRVQGANLAIIGADMRGFGRLLGDPAALSAEGIHILGYQDDRAVASLLSSATAFVHPSLYEGFGFPIVEAMAAGAPVITSSAASLPELGGDAVLYVDPKDPEDIARAMERVAADAALRERLRKDGKTQAGRFSWKENADAMLRIYNEVCAESGGRSR